ncbi:MAG: FG-GAP-like repeat-containing protein [Sandaracinaceae bacterium]
MPLRLTLVPSLLVVLLAVGCDCAGDPMPMCDVDGDCESGEVCTDQMCVPRVEEDAGPPTPDTGPPPMPDAGPPDSGPACESMTLCGSPAQCCAVGEECVGGGCLPACDSGVRCGADRDVCCGMGQVCIDAACESPGDACTDSFDCPLGQFCEPTLSRCIPQFDPVECTTTPTFGPFEPEIEWSFESSMTAPDCVEAITAPLVVDITGDGRPELIINTHCDDAYTRSVLRALDGQTGDEIWVVNDPALVLNGRTSIGGADLDGDGRAEIIAVGQSGRIYAFDDDGTVLWRSFDTDGTTPFSTSVSNGAPTIADLDRDGSPEIIFGALVLNAAGVVQWTRDEGAREGTNSTYFGGISAVADIDMDGEPEIVSGRHAYEADGTDAWPRSPVTTVPDGYPAIAQFDDDPQPEVVLVAVGNVYLLDGLTGLPQRPAVAIPGGGIGGPPTVADFDGDGRPEVGVAGAGSYTVYDFDELDSVLWSMPTQDNTSNATGSSVFDFEGDGAAEVVYADECYLRVYRGSDGAVLLQEDSVSATIHEYPLVADVDSDGNSEIIVVANDISTTLRATCAANDPEGDWDGARSGVFVYGDRLDQWVRTRRVWNQHAYHVTNVGADGTVPTTELDNWTAPGLNNYRQNSQGEGVFNAPDLAILALEVVLDGCPSSATLRARVVNEGSLGVAAGVPVSFYVGTPDALGERLGTASTTVDLLPGATTVVELADIDLEGDPPYSFVAVVDDDGSAASSVTECNEDNNAGAIGDLDCSILF